MGRQAVSRDHAVVVEAEDLDHVLDVALGLDPALAANPGLPGKTGWKSTWPRIVKVMEERLGQAEMGGMVAVEVADLALADAAARARRGFQSWPRRRARR